MPEILRIIPEEFPERPSERIPERISEVSGGILEKHPRGALEEIPKRIPGIPKMWSRRNPLKNSWRNPRTNAK